MKTRSLLIISGIITFLLLIPFFAMQLGDAVHWSLFDFMIAAILLMVTVFLLDYVFRKVKARKYRYVLVLAILALLILTWLELAVGIFGTPFSGS